MKTKITILATVGVMAAFAVTAHAGTKIMTQGRAGYTVIRVDENRSMPRYDSKDTRVALVMEKHEPRSRYRTVGRAGYRIDPSRSDGR